MVLYKYVVYILSVYWKQDDKGNWTFSAASLSGLSFQRLNSSVSHNVNKVGKKGTMPVRGLYLEKSSYQTEFQMKHIDKEVASPNREYAHK